MSDRRDEATESLSGLLAGEARAADRLLPLVYDELRELAARRLRKENREHSLQPTALVHEVYLRLVRSEGHDWRGRAHFLAIAARTLRRVLVDHARQRGAQKRGGALDLIRIDELQLESEGPTSSLELEELLERLAVVSDGQARIAELRILGGLSYEEVASVLDVPVEKVRTEWRFARAWLRREFERCARG